MAAFLKRILSHLPERWVLELKRMKYGFQIRQGRFRTEEKEFDHLAEWISPGDCVLDVGANIGHYTCEFSNLVGPTGRVIALEPMPQTFELLVSNLGKAGCPNVTPLQVGATDRTAFVSMAVPEFDTGLRNYYQAHMTNDDTGMKILGVAIDDLAIPERVSLVKIDAEGQDLAVLRGLHGILKRDHPVLIIEAGADEIASLLAGYGYKAHRIEGSWNTVFQVEQVAVATG